MLWQWYVYKRNKKGPLFTYLYCTISKVFIRGGVSVSLNSAHVKVRGLFSGVGFPHVGPRDQIQIGHPVWRQAPLPTENEGRRMGLVLEREGVSCTCQPDSTQNMRHLRVLYASTLRAKNQSALLK